MAAILSQPYFHRNCSHLLFCTVL